MNSTNKHIRAIRHSIEWKIIERTIDLVREQGLAIQDARTQARAEFGRS